MGRRPPASRPGTADPPAGQVVGAGLREARPGEARAADPPGRGGMEGRGGAARGPPGQGSVCGAAGAVGKGRADTKAGRVTP